MLASSTLAGALAYNGFPVNRWRAGLVLAAALVLAGLAALWAIDSREPLVATVLAPLALTLYPRLKGGKAPLYTGAFIAAGIGATAGYIVAQLYGYPAATSIGALYTFFSGAGGLVGFAAGAANPPARAPEKALLATAILVPLALAAPMAATYIANKPLDCRNGPQYGKVIGAAPEENQILLLLSWNGEQCFALVDSIKGITIDPGNEQLVKLLLRNRIILLNAEKTVREPPLPTIILADNAQPIPSPLLPLALLATSTSIAVKTTHNTQSRGKHATQTRSQENQLQHH